MVQGHDPSPLIHQKELVEGVADIAVAGVHHIVEGIGDLHAGLIHRHGQVGLVVETIAAGVHLVAGAEVEIAAVLIHPQASSIEGHGGVGAQEAGLSQALPVLGVLHHPDDLHVIALRRVRLTENEEVVVRSGEEAAPEGELHGNGPAGLEYEVGRVVLHHDPAVYVLHPGQAVGLVFK